MKRHIKGPAIAVCVVLIAAMAAAAHASTIEYAEPGSVYWAWNPNSPPDPEFDGQGWSWPDPWTPIVLPMDQPMTIPAGGGIFLGLANEEVKDWTKIVTLEFFTGAVVPVEFKAGYEDGETKTWTMELVDSTTTYRKWQGAIFNQPGWEWVRLHNPLQEEQSLRIQSFSSECVIPEPLTITLLSLGMALAGVRRFIG